MLNWSDDSVNYFDAFDKALVHHVAKLFSTSNSDDPQRQTILLKELLTLNEKFDEGLFDFIVWIVSDSNRQVELSKICKIKFISKSDQKLLKLFVEADSRCTLNSKNLVWMKKSLASWLKVCKTDKPKYLAKAEAMIKLTDEYKENEPAKPKAVVAAESKPEQKLSSVASSDSASDYGSTNEDDMVLGSPKERTISRNNSFHRMRNDSPSHRRSFSDYGHSEVIDHPPMIPRPMSMRSMSPMNFQNDWGNSTVAPSVCYDQFDDVIASKDAQIFQLKSELESMHIEIGHLHARKLSSEQIKLEKELKDMMKYYEQAILTKDADYSQLEKQLEEKDLEHEVSLRMIQKELETTKSSFEEKSKSQVLEFAEALSKLEKELAIAHEKNNQLFKNCEVKLEHFRSEIAEKNLLLSYQSNDQSRIAYIRDLENSVSLIKSAQDRLDNELEETKRSRDAILESSTVEIKSLKEELSKQNQKFLQLSNSFDEVVNQQVKIPQPVASPPPEKSSSNDKENLLQLSYIKQLESTNQSMEQEMKQLKSEIDRLSILEAKSKLNESTLTKTVFDLENKIISMKESLFKKDADIEELESKYQESLSTISSLQIQLATPQPVVAELLVIDNEDYKELTIHQCRDLIVSLKKKIIDFQNEKKKIEKELASSRAAYDKLKAATDVIVSYEEDRSTYINNLETKIQTAYDENANLEAKVQELQVALSAKSQAVTTPLPSTKENNEATIEVASIQDKENNKENVNLMNKLDRLQEFGSSNKINSSRQSVNKRLDKRAAEVLKAKTQFQEKLHMTQNIINSVQL